MATGHVWRLVLPCEAKGPTPRHMTTVSPDMLALLRRRLEEIERNVQMLKQLLSEDGSARSSRSPALTPEISAGTAGTPRVIYGRFDGEHMEGEDEQLYPVPANYASKSKLVEGDKLKLTIESDGSFIYKQISPIDRQRVLGTCRVDPSGNYVVETEGKTYRILLASVTFYHLAPGDQVTILLPENVEAHWGAVENVLKPVQAGNPELATSGEEVLPTDTA